MKTPSELNPYESPEQPEAIVNTADDAFSLGRGCFYAVPFGLLGFLIPTLILSTITFLTELTRVPLSWKQISQPGFGCALMFALAAILNFSPTNQLRIGYVTALTYSGGCVIAAVVVAGLIVPYPGRIYDSTPWHQVYRISHWIAATVFATLLTSIFLLSLKPKPHNQK
jgi:hypothetical protein